jgi:hypothetical protein
MSFDQVEGYFLDSCVLLPQSSESKTEACSTFLREASSKCILGSSVKTEAIDLIDRAYNAVVNDFRQNLKPYLEKNGITRLSNRQGKILATYFYERREAFKQTQPQRSSVRNEFMGIIENFVASQLHSLKGGSTIKYDDFLAFLLMQLSLAEHRLKAPFMGIRTEEIVPDESVASMAEFNALIANPHDIKHLASALKYQYEKNKWVIFVTNDESEILSKQPDLFSIFGLQCSKPEWALDYYSDLTRLKAPLEYLREKQDYSEGQKAFVKTLENTMNVRIIADRPIF